MGASVLGDSLASTRIRLKHLDLSNNSIDESGGLRIAQGVKKNKSLVLLNLKYNNLKNETGKALVDALNYNSKIRKIFLQYNAISFRHIGDIDKY